MNLNIEENIPLSDMSTLKVGGPAKFLIRIKNKEDLVEAVDFAKGQNLPIVVLGGGSNILFSDGGFSGLVLKLETTGTHFEKSAQGVLVHSEAGENWDNLVRDTVERDLWGIENLSAIPGTVGASVIQNIGAYGSEVKDTVQSVEVFDMNDSTFKKIQNTDCKFGYRDSVFKKEEGSRFVVTAVTFLLHQSGKANISYKDLAKFFENKKELPSLREVREAVLEIRSKKFPNLDEYGTAGSFFKNVIVDAQTFENISRKFPDVVAFDTDGHKKKVSTAWILDKVCGLKGYKNGNVELFVNQPLVVVARQEASADEIKKFVSKIKNIVREKISIDLEYEVQIV